ncbi:MAG TPA: hypothetical protein VNE63_03790 [Candidatus Acidoferrales bacterium]|nr:hypothetical protein [Candidatus Acidoferrales bacterium]
MPFIQGRYHINPVLGEALEAARQAEASLLDLEQQAQNGEDDANGGANAGVGQAKGPIHRVEIEAAEVVPAHSGRAAHGYVAQVHRQPAAGENDEELGGLSGSRNAAANGANTLARTAARTRGAAVSRPETHVFSDHRDLLSFLRDELAKDRKNQG